MDCETVVLLALTPRWVVVMLVGGCLVVGTAVVKSFVLTLIICKLLKSSPFLIISIL